MAVFLAKPRQFGLDGSARLQLLFERSVGQERPFLVVDQVDVDLEVTGDLLVQEALLNVLLTPTGLKSRVKLRLCRSLMEESPVGPSFYHDVWRFSVYRSWGGSEERAGFASLRRGRKR